MDQLGLIVVFLFLTALLNFCSKKFKMNIDLNNLSPHKNLNKKKIIPLSGGILFLVYLIFGFDLSINIVIFLSLILFMGYLSDNMILNSASLRLILQIFIFIFFVKFLNIEINSTGLILLDNIIDNNYFNIIFCSLCFLILINGSNFIDGVNTNVIGYYLSVYASLFLLLKKNSYLYLNIEIENIIIILTILYLFNFFQKLFLGDSGSYLISSFTGYILIKLAYFNENISPFFIALLLWYPAYELLFSIIRKLNLSKSPLLPDKKHFHHLMFFFLKKNISKYNIFSNYINTFSGLIITMYNLILFIFATKYYYNTQILILLFVFSIFVYSIIYYRLVMFLAPVK